MRLIKGLRRGGVVAAASTAAVIVATGVAVAATFAIGGSTTTLQRVNTTDTPFLVGTAAAWQDVPNTAISVSVPSSRARVESTFNAESLCVKVSWCTTRAVVVNAAGAITELLPASGTDYAFDSPTVANAWHSETMNRDSLFLAGGTYTVKVQAMMVSPVAGAMFRIDDYSHRVKLIAP